MAMRENCLLLCDGGWTDCTNAHIEDANYAEMATDGIQCVWSNFDFPTISQINSVEVKVQTHVGNDSKHGISLEVWNGSEWGPIHNITPTEVACTEEIIDITGDFIWTGEMVEQIKVRLTANIGGGAPADKWVRCCFIEITVIHY